MTRYSTRLSTSAVLGALLIGRAGHWFITPMRHPNSPIWKTLFVGALFVVGVGLVIHAAVLRRQERTEERAFEHLDRNG